jgi:hypothetical protein
MTKGSVPIITISCVKIKASSLLSITYLLSTRLVPKFSWHRGKATQKKVIYAKSRYRSDRWPQFKFTPTLALPRCLSNKISTSLRSKEKPSMRNLTHRFHLWFVLVCWGMPVRGANLSPVARNTIAVCHSCYLP